MRRVTIRDVARHAGVSIGTVSNALNRPDLVADDTLARIVKAINHVGFVRNSAARQLRSARSPAIGHIVLDINNPFFTEMASGVEAAASEIDYIVILCNSGGDRTREDRHLRLLEEQRVAGVLITPTTRNPSKLCREVRERGTPVVLLDRRSSRRDQCSVAVNDIEGGHLAAQHLIDLAHRRIALVNGPRQIPQCADRRAGFLAALGSAGQRLRASDDIEMDEMTISAGHRAANKLLAGRNPPSAVFCTNDLLALGVEHAILATELRVPDDIAVVGYDDLPFANMAFVPLTSIRQPAFDLGYRAAQLLLSEASGDAHRHEHVTFAPEIVVRNSTMGALATTPKGGPPRARVSTR